ncbi:MAG: hypothetical protein APF80_14985 [Alphaproteobacteria bacterium BRH_c36]|nr:MAG: hypothetical protein APF80_14985 [Alphaproteobacteria bacterium BRH_c36]
MDRSYGPALASSCADAANRRERLHVTAQQRLQILMHDKAGEDEAGMAENEGEQPDDPGHAGIVGELGHEACEVNLGLLAGRRLEAHLEGLWPMFRPDRGDEPLHRRVGPRVALFADITIEPDGAELREGGNARAKIVEVGCQFARSARLPRTVGRWLQAALDVLPDRLWVTASAPDYGADRPPLPMKVQYHDEISKLDHPRHPRPNQFGRQWWIAAKRLTGGGARPTPCQAKVPAREFSMPTIREYSTPGDTATAPSGALNSTTPSSRTPKASPKKPINSTQGGSAVEFPYSSL